MWSRYFVLFILLCATCVETVAYILSPMGQKFIKTLARMLYGASLPPPIYLMICPLVNLQEILQHVYVYLLTSAHALHVIISCTQGLNYML